MIVIAINSQMKNFSCQFFFRPTAKCTSNVQSLSPTGRFRYYPGGNPFNSEGRNHDELVKRNAPSLDVRGNISVERAYVGG